MGSTDGARATEEERLAAVHRLDLLDTPPEERFDRAQEAVDRVLALAAGSGTRPDDVTVVAVRRGAAT
ncbi:SpoIIE family protein phosphatase [Cellulomonas sp. JZ18]|uniref:SpoIIE family protein phosphatase n=1 Tax=Cellulomonas sp. JZ18 TaxID=2654191 RepID=UPI0012D405F8|nr:SpoIIE family protein phosphatase [Cellulomonas sp. JZ18]QGQ20553.1 SpoIIE family protein phosphatase [Cellulomonas sp. JZ18]